MGLPRVPQELFRAVKVLADGREIVLGTDFDGTNVRRYIKQATSLIKVDTLGRKEEDVRYRIETLTVTGSVDISASTARTL